MTFPVWFSKKFSYLAFFSIFLGSMYLLFLNPVLDIRGFNANDPAAYINKAIGLWRGIGYGEQFANTFLPVTGQPPVFSLLLAPVVGIFGVNFVILKLYMLFFSLLLGVTIYPFFKYFLKEKKQAVVATFLMMTSPVIFGLSHRVLADVPMFVFMVLGLFTLNRYLREPVPIFSSGLFIASLTASVAYLTKQTALGVFIGGWFLWLHPDFRNRIVFKKLLAYSIISCIPILAWHTWCATLPDNLWYWTTPATRDYLWKNPFTIKDGYISILDFITRMRHNIVWGISNNIAMVFFAPFYFTEGSLFGFFASLPVMLWLSWQWIRSFIKSPSVLEGFVFFSLALFIPKFMGFAARYVAIIWPAVLVYAVRGIAQLPKKFQTYFLSSLCIVSLVTTLVISINQWKNPYGSETLKDYVAAAQEAKKIFPSDSKCAAPLLTHWQILTGHQCFYGKDSAVLPYLLSTGSAYLVVLSDHAPRDLEHFKDVELQALEAGVRLIKILEQKQSLFEKVFENKTFMLMKVKNAN